MRILLSQGKYAIVDDSDYQFLNQWKWSLSSGYAVRIVKAKGIHMHRLVNKTPDHMETDHVDGDKLNNRKINLRSVTLRQNAWNRPSCVGSSSRFKGVFWIKRRNKWGAKIVYMGKQIWLGQFKCEVEAAVKYDVAANNYFGEFARPNFQVRAH